MNGLLEVSLLPAIVTLGVKKVVMKEKDFMLIYSNSVSTKITNQL